MPNNETKNIKTIQSLRGMKDIVNEESSLFTMSELSPTDLLNKAVSSNKGVSIYVNP